MSMTFLSGALLAISVATSLTVEAFKKIFDGMHVKYSSNVLAAITSVLLTIGVSIAYFVLNDVELTTKARVAVVVLMYLSFLTSTVGYDKVIQMLGQIKNNK